MKKTLLAAALFAASTGAVAAGHESGVKVSGHVNYVVREITELGDEGLADAEFAENGDVVEDLRVEDDTTSGSRFRIVAEKKGDITWGTKLEFGVTSAALSTRHSHLYAKGDFGKVTLGQGSEVGDGYTEIDHSGTYVLTGNNGVFEAGVAVTGGGRTENLRYDSPKLGGLATLSASYNEDETNIGIHLKSSIWEAALYSESNTDETEADEQGGSVSATFGTFTAALQYSVDEAVGGADDGDTEKTKVILGYKSGPISVAVDFGTQEDDDVADDLEHVGLSFVYRPAKGVELYAGTRSVEQGSADGSGIAVGSRIKF